MYLIGKEFNDNRFKLIYGIFKDESKAESFLKDTKGDLRITKFENYNFPFFIIEELEDTNHFYYPVNKQELRERIDRITQLNDFNTMYFNLWRINCDGYNKNYPKEPFLNGRDWHLHFMNHDIQQIEKGGFDKYWNDILNT